MGVWDGRSHTVSAGVTRARSGASGRAPGIAPGQLPAYRVRTAAHSATASGGFPHGEGFDAATSVLVPSMSSARENVYKNADGSYTARLYTQPVNYRRADGSWAAIDTTLKPRVSGKSTSYVTASTATDTQFASSAADPALVTFQFDASDAVSFGIQGAAPVAPVVSGSTATYPSALTDTDVVLNPTAAGVKESLVLHSASAPTQFVYPLTLTGVTASVGSDGSVWFINGAGTVVGEIPHGEMSDANYAPYTGLAASSDGVTYSLTTLNGSSALVMTLDQGWLDDPARVFPVTVDPTLTPVNASSSTYALYPCTNNNSTDTVLKVGTPGVNSPQCGSANLAAVSYLAFPSVPSQLANDYVTGASLTLYNVWSYTCSATPFAVGAVNSGWSASGITSWSNKPGYGGNLVTSESDTPGSACGSNSPSNPGAFMTAHLSTAVFNGWTGGTSSDFGLAVYAPTVNSSGYPTNPNEWKQFASTAAGVASSNYPYLSITYQANTAPNVVSANPPNGQAQLTLTPELTAQAQDPDAFPGKALQYEFRVMEDSSGTPNQVSDSGTLASGSATSSQAWSVPSGVLNTAAALS
jgi:hypothetical protein